MSSFGSLIFSTKTAFPSLQVDSPIHLPLFAYYGMCSHTFHLGGGGPLGKKMNASLKQLSTQLFFR
jgi:hypothetical protein